MSSIKIFCDKCGTIHEDLKEHKKAGKLLIRDEYISTRIFYHVCPDCSQEFYTPQQHRRSRHIANRIYQDKRGLYNSDDFKKIRSNWGLSQLEMAHLFSWGAKTPYMYERGGLQTRAHNRIVELMTNPAIMKRVLEYKSLNLPKEKIANLLKMCDAKLKNKK